ncbi:TPA: carbohydrate ABC transporter permease, partial [Streptococcus suis]|nr:carbohydrate ABC transporter permease [Streptococcus suis]
MKKKNGLLLDIFSHLFLASATIIAIFPLVWIIISSIKGKGELTQFPTRFWPQTFTF